MVPAGGCRRCAACPVDKYKELTLIDSISRVDLHKGLRTTQVAYRDVWLGGGVGGSGYIALMMSAGPQAAPPDDSEVVSLASEE